MNFIVLACNDLGIEPPIDDRVGWRPIRNPYSVGGHTKERDISAVVRWFAKNKGVSVDWPGDDVGVDFLSWYAGQADAKPKRGENMTATATVPARDAALGGSARVVLPTGRALDVTIPAGIEEGKQIRLRGQGQPGPIGGEPGDALITIKIAPHDEGDSRLADSVPISGSLPDVTSGETSRSFQSDSYHAFFVKNAKSIMAKISEKPIFSYPYTLVVVDPQIKLPVLFVTLEQSIFGTRCLGVFDRSGGHSNLGDPGDLWGNEQAFIDRAIKLVQAEFGERLHELSLKPVSSQTGLRR
jgi:hypothetical protein